MTDDAKETILEWFLAAVILTALIVKIVKGIRVVR